jgi:hypothetical protein
MAGAHAAPTAMPTHAVADAQQGFRFVARWQYHWCLLLRCGCLLQLAGSCSRWLSGLDRGGGAREHTATAKTACRTGQTPGRRGPCTGLRGDQLLLKLICSQLVHSTGRDASQHRDRATGCATAHAGLAPQRSAHCDVTLSTGDVCISRHSRCITEPRVPRGAAESAAWLLLNEPTARPRQPSRRQKWISYSPNTFNCNTAVRRLSMDVCASPVPLQ